MRLFPFIALLFLFSACNTEDHEVSPSNQSNIPVVQSASVYDVILEEDIVYAQGLSHMTLNGTEASVMDLKLDVYQPDNNLENRPAYLFIHGGGFKGGSKKGGTITNMANYFASRGWVFISIDYRLSKHLGTVPQEWADYANSLPDEFVSQYLAIYPAHRDAKAALRWVMANADAYHINPDFLSVGGGSAGAITAITISVSEPEDYTNELPLSEDPTLSTTNLGQTYQVRTIIDFWGSDVALDALEQVYGHQRFDTNDPALFIAHGTEDPTVLFENAEELKATYESLGLPFVFYPFEGLGHGIWNATLDGKRLEELSYDFIVEQQTLVVE